VKTFKKTGSLFSLLIPLLLYSQERLIKPGDAIEIIIPQTEELNKIIVVGPDGAVDFPGMQGLPIDGITLQRFKEVLVNQLVPFLGSTPLVMVRFSESYPIKVNVLGQVAMPGLHQIANTATLQGAIGAAGGFIPGAQLAKIRLIRGSGQSKHEQIINMEQFYLNGDPSVLPPIENDDTIVVPGNPLATTIKVLGGVENPGSYQVFFQTTLLDAIFLAGGPTSDANLKKIRIVSLTGEDTREISININKLLAAKSFSTIPIVVPGDVVYVPEKIVTWSKFFNVVQDVSTLVTVYYLIYLTLDN
jgi:polysaccharide export outer membrane protein